VPFLRFCDNDGVMRPIRHRARLIAAIALAWHVVAIGAVSAALSCDSSSEHAGMANCPLHESVPVCPVHAEKHGSHDCDCPTIGCAQTDAGFMALFGSIGILPPPSHMPVPLDAGDALPRAAASTNPRAPVPLAPPPRS
jgi:hypothetical protein